jgi:hypothetical protein
MTAAPLPTSTALPTLITVKEESSLSWLWLAYAVLLFVLLLFSHIQFAYAGRNRNYFQPVVVFVSIAVMFVVFLVPCVQISHSDSKLTTAIYDPR